VKILEVYNTHNNDWLIGEHDETGPWEAAIGRREAALIKALTRAFEMISYDIQPAEDELTAILKEGL